MNEAKQEELRKGYTMGKRASKRGRGFGNASPITGMEGEADLATKRVVRVCETPEFFELHGCPHGRAAKATDE